MRALRFALPALSLAIVGLSDAQGQEPAKEAPRPLENLRQATQIDEEAAARQKLFDKFRETMSGADLVGHFTVVGRNDRPPREERYSIKTVTKMEAGDYWLFTARVRYADKDVTIPMPLEVKWAGDTPIITLTNLTIPGLGTFSSRVVIDDKKYAGTWRHGEVHGHLFGVIERTAPDGDAAEPGRP